tara:strand:- start:241 stop:690 length:450 start_codon:yes stop_codon:yes gene_type:complete
MQLTVRKMQPQDYSDCWNVQHSNHTEPESNLYSLETWKFICDLMSDSFVVCDGKIVVGYWLGFLKVNTHEPEPDVWCFAVDVCTHADYREKGVMDLIMPHATSYHPRIYAYTQKGNTAAEGIMSKWGFNKGEYYPDTNNHYWSFEQEGL